MDTAKEYRQYANECLHSADEAATDEQRQSFLGMARDWTLAAVRLESAAILEAASQQRAYSAWPMRHVARRD
jgi:hypothetical protein